MYRAIMNATLNDIARAVGCSNATVSRVINNVGQVAPEMREAVLSAIRQFNYVPRPGAMRPDDSADQKETSLVELILFWDAPYEPVTYSNSNLNVGPLKEFPHEQRLNDANWLSDSFTRLIIDGVLYESPQWNFKTAIQM